MPDLAIPFDDGCWVVVRSHKYKRRRDYRAKAKKGKFGRFLVELFGWDPAMKQWVNINQLVYSFGHAKLYTP